MWKKALVNSILFTALTGFIITAIFTQAFSAAEMDSHAGQSLSIMAEIVPELERQIRAGQTTTANEIIPVHPRIWLRGPEDWNKDKFGSYAWRIVHGPAMGIEFPSFAHDDAKYAFYDAANLEDEVFNQIDWSDVNVRLMALITAGKAVSLAS